MDDVAEFPSGRKPYAAGADGAQAVVAIQGRRARVSVRLLPDDEEMRACVLLLRMMGSGEAPCRRADVAAVARRPAAFLQSRRGGRAAA